MASKEEVRNAVKGLQAELDRDAPAIAKVLDEMRCPNCQQPSEDYDTTCRHCGASLQVAPR